MSKVLLINLFYKANSIHIILFTTFSAKEGQLRGYLLTFLVEYSQLNWPFYWVPKVWHPG